jgi:hypothetical protein
MYTKEMQTNKNKEKEVDLSDRSITIRLKKDEIKKRVQWLLDKEVCQVCENSTNLDYPHHAIFGWSNKDDRTMINICVDCHRTIHTKGYGPLKKDRSTIENIGWSNNEEYLECIKY